MKRNKNKADIDVQACEITFLSQYKKQNQYLEIAIIDDDQEILNFLRKSLSLQLHTMVYATQKPKHFIKVIQRNNIDLCLIDINLNHKLNGLDLVELIKTDLFFDIPIMIISSEKIDLDLLCPNRNIQHLRKPFSSNHLINKINEMIHSEDLNLDVPA